MHNSIFYKTTSAFIFKPILAVAVVIIIISGTWLIGTTQESPKENEELKTAADLSLETQAQALLGNSLKETFKSPPPENNSADKTADMADAAKDKKLAPEASFTPNLTRREEPPEIKAIHVTAKEILGQHQSYLLSLFEKTELNAVVIAVKDATGVHQEPALKSLIKKLKAKDVWTIARLVVFQDNFLAKKSPHTALKTVDGGLWQDSGGLYWVDPASHEVWDYKLNLAEKMAALGFDEINFDYIRFPSDGPLDAIQYPVWDKATPKTEVIKLFFEYLTSNLVAHNPNVYLSADLFAYNLLSFIKNDEVTGQRVEDAALYFDILAPMTYPSHYLPGNFGFSNPAEHPYEVIRQTVEEGRQKILKVRDRVIMRPWLQAFDLGAVYDKNMIDLEKKAVKDAGLDYGWMLWNPNNFYPEDFFEPKPIQEDALGG